MTEADAGSNCPSGGTALTAANGTSYVCNGTNSGNGGPPAAYTLFKGIPFQGTHISFQFFVPDGTYDVNFAVTSRTSKRTASPRTPRVSPRPARSLPIAPAQDSRMTDGSGVDPDPARRPGQADRKRHRDHYRWFRTRARMQRHLHGIPVQYQSVELDAVAVDPQPAASA